MSNSSTITNGMPDTEIRSPRMHPGEVVEELFLIGEGLGAADLAKSLGWTVDAVNEFLKGNRDIDADFALKLNRALGPSPRYWMNMQANYDLKLAEGRAPHSNDAITPLYDAAE
ncbi:MAG: HigA family addiction module antitoxin [Pseudomonadota bacterium]